MKKAKAGLFDLSGQKALVVGYQGNFGPIWVDALEEAGAIVYEFGWPEVDFRLRSAVFENDMPNIVPDIIVCNAAIDTPPSQSSARFFDDFAEILRVNVESHVRIIEYYLPQMIEKQYGVIVLIGSIMGHVGANWKNYTPPFEKPVGYNVSKGALLILAKCLTVQYGRYGIRAVCPSFGPYISGKLPEEFLNKIVEAIPMGRTLSIRDLKQTLLYACSCDSLAGANWLVDGGYTIW